MKLTALFFILMLTGCSQTCAPSSDPAAEGLGCWDIVEELKAKMEYLEELEKMEQQDKDKLK